jgi:predicted ATPase
MGANVRTRDYAMAMTSLQTLAVANYRSIRSLVVPLGDLTLVTGANGSGKSNLYRALRLLADAAQGGIVASLAKEGGLASTLWAGPEQISRRMKSGEIPVQGGPRTQVVALRLGFVTEAIGYCIDLGLPSPEIPPPPEPSAFQLDPEIKRECVWAAPVLRPASVLVDRRGPSVRIRRTDGEWDVIGKHLPTFESMLSAMADPERAPELLRLREEVRSWRFYDHFRADSEAAPRHIQLGTRTPVLAHDGRDVAAAIQTIVEIGDRTALDRAVGDAFPGAKVYVEHGGGRFSLKFSQHGLLRPLSAAELSDGTLRYLLWIAALLTPRPPALMILNEPETSLHPDLLPALARLIAQTAKQTQIWVVSHASRLIAALREAPHCTTINLHKELGETAIEDQGTLDAPSWRWPER